MGGGCIRGLGSDKEFNVLDLEGVVLGACDPPALLSCPQEEEEGGP